MTQLECELAHISAGVSKNDQAILVLVAWSILDQNNILCQIFVLKRVHKYQEGGTWQCFVPTVEQRIQTRQYSV